MAIILADPEDNRPESRREFGAGPSVTTKVAAAVSAGTALWLSIGMLAVTDAETAHRIGFLPSWWLLPIFIVATTAIVVGLRLPSVVYLPLLCAVLIVLPWLPLPVPDVFLAIAGPAVWLVWGAIACGSIAIGVWSMRPRWWSVLGTPAAAQYAAAIAALVVFLAVWAGQRLPPTGDEPHYLVIAQSLLRDGDVKVANNYERGDYLPYYRGFLTPHYASGGAGVERYPGHGVGLSAIIAPAFALGGYRAVAVWIAVLVAIGAGLVWKAGYVLTSDVGAAWFGWAVVVLTAPIAVYGSLIYPDSIAGIVFAACALAVVQADARTERTPWRLTGSVALGAAIGVLPWLHVRLALPACIFAIVLLARATRFGQGRARHVAAMSAPFAVSLAGFMAFSWLINGSINPAASIGDRSSLQVQRIPVGLLAMLTDQEFGLLPNAPVHLVSFAALWSVLKRNRRLGLDLVLIVVPYALTLSAWSIWWAGACPPARFLVPVIFPLGVAAAGLWVRQGARGHVLSLTMLVTSVVIAVVFAWAGDGALAYSDATGRARWLEWASPLVDVSRAFPSFFRAGALNPTSQTVADLAWPTSIWVLAALAGWTLFAALDRRLEPSPPARGVTCALCLALAIGIAITGSWRIAGGNHLSPTRAQLDVLHTTHGRLRPIGVQFSPWLLGSSRELTTRFAITTSTFDTVARNTLLLLNEVPAGDYQLQVTHGPASHGELDLAIGRASLPIERWPVSDEWNDYTFHLGASASSLIVTGNEAALRSVQRVALVPVAPRDEPSAPARARDAARYGPVVVYALDDRVSLDTGGFWVLGERRPDVIVSANHPVSFVDLFVRNMPIANTIRVRSGRWYVERALAAEEEWRVRVPLPEPVQDVTIGFDVASGVRPADLNAASRDRRSLGCWVEVK
jgi:hypothetical protein